jgi:hypothetical protein
MATQVSVQTAATAVFYYDAERRHAHSLKTWNVRQIIGNALPYNICVRSQVH